MEFVIYGRTSDANGDEESIEAQHESAAAWAARNGHGIAESFADDGRSGTLTLAEREGLTEAVAAIERGEADGLLVTRLDRIARALHVQEAVLAFVWAAGGVVYEVHGGEVQQDDPDDPMRKAMRQMRGVFHELEKNMIVARMQGGRRRASAKGRYIGGARLHRKYGYDLIDGEYVERADEQAVIARMRELRDPPYGKTFRAIADSLTAEGVEPPSGERWHPSGVMRIIRREEKRAAVA